MTLVEQSDDSFVFEFQRREQRVFLAILSLYPVLNPDYHQLARNPASDHRTQESESLLQEAMAHQREENKKRVTRFVADENWEKRENRFRVKIRTEEVEWLLQVLNDVRVGSWVILGKPDPESGEKAEVTAENMQYVGALELSGYFQMALLQARER